MKTPLCLAVLALSTLSACGSTRYGDPNQVETLTIGYGSTDLQSLAADMVDSLTASPALSYLDTSGKGADKRVIVYVGGVENRTNEHIDTSGISDKIQTQLLKGGKFRFVAADAGQAEIDDQVRFQQSGKVREDMMAAYGRQLGADVILYGTLRSIDKKKGASLATGGVRTKDKFYQYVMKCVNIDTGEILWIEESELRKTERAGVFDRI